MANWSLRQLGGLGVLALLIFASSQSTAAQPSKSRNSLAAIQTRHHDRYREFSSELNKLVDFCEDKGLQDAADTVRSRLISPESQTLKLQSLPSEVQPEISNQLPPDERYWQTQLRHLEKEYAKDLYVLSRQPLHNGNPGYAYRLVREAALHDPDHPQVRKILGFVQSGKEWLTPFAADQIKKGNVWHKKFGWLPKNHLTRYANDERYYEGSWVSVSKEAVHRSDFAEGWQVRTDHYLIKTNHSLERGVELGLALESYYAFFHETFAGFFNTPEQLKKLFEGTARSVRPDAKPYTVHYYKTREEYLNRLQKQFPSIRQTNGVYMTNDRVAHFYHDPEANNEATLFHEATHQLFFESHNQPRPIGEKAHFWIIEGIACYMESFQHKNDEYSLGDPHYIRFAGARVNLLEKKYYVPLREFSGLGMQEFQHASELAKNYTQASGLARFFMHFDDGRYREALVTHLSQLYSGDTRVRDRATGLDELTGVDFEELDRQYAEDSRRIEADLTAER